MTDEPIVPTRSRGKIQADVREELDAWIDERAAELIGEGTSPENAREQARREFGDAAATERYCAGQDTAADRRIRVRIWLEEFFADMRIAARTLARTPTIAVVVLLTFGIGVGATTAVFSAIHSLLLRPLPYPDENAVVQIPSVTNGEIGPGAQLSATALVALRERTTSFSAVGGAGWGGYALVENGEPEVVSGGRVTANMFDVLGTRAAIGRTLIAGDDSSGAAPVVVLSHGLWQRRFGGDSSIVGRTIDLSGAMRTVVGVMPPRFRLPTMEETEIWVPLDLAPVLRDVNRAQRFRFMRLFAREKPGVTHDAARADVDRTMLALAKEFPASFEGIGATVRSVRTAVVGDTSARLLVLMGAAAFVLLIACANIAGLLLARALSRRHETTVRIALGAGRRRLIRQFLAEGAVLSLSGGAIGLAIAALGVAALRRITVSSVPDGTTFAIEPQVLAFAMVITAAGGLLFSLVPAFAATRGAHTTLRQREGSGATSRSQARMRLGLITGQLAVSVALLVAAGLFLRSMHRLTTLDLGYSTERILTFDVGLPLSRYGTAAKQDIFWDALHEQLRAVPGVVAVGSAGNLPLGGGAGASLSIEGRIVEGERPPESRYASVSDDYFETLGIPLVRGRMFSSIDHDDGPNVVIISNTLAKRFWPAGDPIGVRVKIGPDPSVPWSTIIGVVGDVRFGAAGEYMPTVYASARQDHWGGGAVLVRTAGDPVALTAGVRDAVKRVDPILPIANVQTLDQYRDATQVVADRRLQLQLMLVFAIAALLLSAIGVYGTSAYSVEARRREFGIRMALGAPRSRVLMLALRDGARAAVIGVLLGVPLSLLLASQLRELLFQVQPFDPATVAVVLAVLGLVVLAASVGPARRATRVDPVRAMRSD